MIYSDAWDTREPGGLPSCYIGGANPPDERKEGVADDDYISDLVQTGIFIVALIGLCYTIFRGKRK